jgi:hypothetical protein
MQRVYDLERTLLHFERRNAVEVAILLLTITALSFRIFVPASILNLFVDYTNDGGSPLVKFHLGAYALIGALITAVFTRPFFLKGSELHQFRMLLHVVCMIICLTLVIVTLSGFRATGFIIDTYLLAMLAGLLLLTQSRPARRSVGELIIALMVLSALLGIGEVLTQERFLPFNEGEAVFRPTGLAGHPLALGAHITLVMGFVPLTRWRVWLKVLLTLVLFVALAASGARLAMIAGGVQVLLLLYFSPWSSLPHQQAKKARSATLVVVLTIGAFLILFLAAGGLLDRFSNGLVDENVMARVTIYQIFGYVSWRDIFFGMDAVTLLALVRAQLDLPFIESAPVYIILTLGLPAAIAFTAVIVFFFTKLLKGAPVQAKIASLVFLAVDLSNNGLATKNPDIILLTTLVIAFFHSAPASNVERDQQVLSTTSSRPARLSV